MLVQLDTKKSGRLCDSYAVTIAVVVFFNYGAGLLGMLEFRVCSQNGFFFMTHSEHVQAFLIRQEHKPILFGSK